MFLASAYPNSAISAWAMAAIALVAVGSLTCWLVLVFLAARKSAKPGVSHRPVVTQHGKAAEDEGSEAPVAAPDRRYGAAA